MSREARAPVVEIALGAMSAMTEPQYRTFRRVLTGLVEADAKRNVFEWMLERLVEGVLASKFEGKRRAEQAGLGIHFQARAVLLNERDLDHR